MKVKFEDLKDGAIIYKVTVWGDFEVRAFAQAMLIIGEPYESKLTAPELFCRFKVIDQKHHYITDFSLRDANIVPNTYNLHQAFTTREEANAYLERILNPDFHTDFEREHFRKSISRACF
jgi:hypothetical protein